MALGPKQKMGPPKLPRPRAGMPIRARETRAIIDAIERNGITGPQQFHHYLPIDQMSLGWQMIEPAKARILAGRFAIAGGDLDIEVAQTDVTLVGNPEYVYLQHEWNANTATIEHSSSLPEADATYYVHRLLKLDPTDGVYFPTHYYHLGGDIVLASPKRGGAV